MADKQPFKLKVRVQANAGKTGVNVFSDGILQVKIAAPAVDGKANEALIKLLSETFEVPKSRITIEKGATAKIKILSITGNSEAITAILRKISPGGSSNIQ